MARVLIIDDDSRLCDVYKEELGEEYDVVTSCSACQAIMRLGELHPDVVVLDICMPDMNGIDALGQILERDRKLPVILNSSFSHYRSEFMTWAAEDYVVKSGDIAPLRGAIGRALLGHRVAPGAAVPA